MSHMDGPKSEGKEAKDKKKHKVGEEMALMLYPTKELIFKGMNI